VKKKAAYLSVTLVAVLGFALASFISNAAAHRRAHALCGPYTECTVTTTTATTTTATTATTGTVAVSTGTTTTVGTTTTPKPKPKPKMCRVPKKLSFKQDQRASREVLWVAFLGGSHKFTRRGTGRTIRFVTFKFTRKRVNLVSWLADGEVVEHFYSYNAKQCREIVRKKWVVLHREVSKTRGTIISKVTPIYS
jgi:hypothetical protein